MDGRKPSKALLAYRARREKEREAEAEEDEEDDTDIKAYEARLYRKFWNDVFADECGSYEDTTSIPPACFTARTSQFAGTQPTLQIFSVKIEEITGGLRWPLDVYGIVAVRDIVDHNRNIIFNCQRDNSQSIPKKDPYLALTGPTRAVVSSVHPTYFEADLKVKGAVKSEDKDLSFLAVCYISNGGDGARVINLVATSKLSTLKFTFGDIPNSVEATIDVKVISGEWPPGYQGVFTAKTSSIDGMDVVLLAFKDGKLPMDDERKVKLTRRVVSIELVQPMPKLKRSKLKFSVQALHISEKRDIFKEYMYFMPKKDGTSQGIIKAGSCTMQVTVAWSLLATFKCI